MKLKLNYQIKNLFTFIFVKFKFEQLAIIIIFFN